MKTPLRAATTVLRVRYGGVATFVAAGIVVLLLALSWRAPATPAATDRAVLPAPAGPSTSLPPATEHDGRRAYLPGRPAKPDSDAVAVAAAFAVAWSRPGLDATAWWGDIRPYCERGFAEALRTTDPRTIPARRVIGAPRTTHATADLVTLGVPTDRGELEVTLALMDGTWKVVANDWKRA